MMSKQSFSHPHDRLFPCLESTAFTGPVTLTVSLINDPNGKDITDLSDWALFDSSGTITSSAVSVPNSEIDTLEITAPPSVLAGVYSVTVTGTDSSGHTSAATINVDVPTGFSVTAEPGALTVAPGASAPVTIGVNAEGVESDNISFNSTVTDAYGNPVTGPAPSISFGGSIAIGSSAAETVTVPSLTAPGDYYIDVVGTDSGGNTSDAMIDVTVQTGGFIITPEESNLSVSVGTASQQDTLTVSALGSFAGLVKIAAAVTNSAGTPVQGGLSASLADPSSVTLPSSNSDVLTVTAPPGTPVGQYMVTITGTDSNGNAVTSLVMVAVTAGYSLNASPTSLSLVAGSSGSSAITATAIGTGGGPVHLSAIVKDSNGIAVADNSVTVQLSSPTVTIGSATPSVATVTASQSAVSGSTYRVVILGKDAGGAAAGTGIGVTIASASLTVSASPQTMNIAQGTQSEPETVTVNSTTGMTGTVTTTVAITSQSGGACPPGLTSWFPASEPLDGTGTLTFTGTFNADTTVPAGTYTATITCTNGTSSASATVTLVVAPVFLSVTDDGFNPQFPLVGQVGTDQLHAVLSSANTPGQTVTYAWSVPTVWSSVSDNPLNFSIDTSSDYTFGWEDSSGDAVTNPTVPEPVFTGCFYNVNYYTMEITCTATVTNGSNTQVVSASCYPGGPPVTAASTGSVADDEAVASAELRTKGKKHGWAGKAIKPNPFNLIVQTGSQNPLPVNVPAAGTGPNTATFTAQVTPGPNNVIPGYVIFNCVWSQPTLASPGYAAPSSTGKLTWTTAPSIQPSFSVSSQSGSSASTITASVPAGCPAGYWKANYAVSVIGMLNGKYQNQDIVAADVILTVGAGTTPPSFSLSIDRSSLKISSGTGGVCELTLTSLNGFQGDVNVTSTAAGGLQTYLFNLGKLPPNAADSPGIPSCVVHLSANKTDTVSMTVCSCTAAPNADANGNPKAANASAYSVSVSASATNGGASTQTSKLGVWIRPTLPPIPTPPSPGDDFPGGIGRRVSTRDPFVGISGYATLPSCTAGANGASGVNIDLCQDTNLQGAPPLADAADIYLGTIGGFASDFGLTVGHSGKDWAVLPNGIRMRKGTNMHTYAGTVLMTLELPGFNRAANGQVCPSGASWCANGIVAPGYIVLQINGDPYVCYAETVTGPERVKRCNTIAQKITSGSGSGFVQSGSSVRGAAWSGMKVYGTDNTTKKGIAMNTSTIPCIQFTYPGPPKYKGPPYISYKIVSPFASEANINMSTVPLSPGN